MHNFFFIAISDKKNNLIMFLRRCYLCLNSETKFVSILVLQLVINLNKFYSLKVNHKETYFEQGISNE